MPTIGERRSGATETVEWNGQRWEPIETQQAAEPLDALLKRADALTAGNAPVDVSQNPRVKAANALQDPGQGTYFREHPYQESPSADPLHAMLGSGFDTAKKAGVGMVKGAASLADPRTYVNAAGDAVRGIGELGTLAADPSLLLEAPAAAKAGVKYLGDNPEEGGRLLGQLLAGEAAPAVVPKVLEGADVAAGATARGLNRFGRATEEYGGKMAAARADTPITLGGIGVATGHPIAGASIAAAKAAAPYVVKYSGKGMQAAGNALEALRSKAFSGADWSKDASARPAWDPAGPSRRAAAEAEQEAAYGRSNDQRYAENTRARSDAAGNSAAPLADQMEGVMRGVPDEFGSRAESMGRNTVADMQRAGYDVPDTGFTSTRDIDALGKRPDADIALQALREKAAASARTAPPTSDFFTKPQAFGPEPTQEDIIGSIDRSANEGLGRVDENADVPEFSHEARDANTPSLTIPQNALRAQQQAESLRALMNLPSFRGLR